MNLKEIQEDFNKVIKPQLEEILKQLNKLQTNNVIDIIEAASAKVIKDICEKMDKCDCFEKYINEVKTVNPLPENQERKIVSTTGFGLTKYSYPNYNVGNAELGSSGDPNSMVWPFGLTKK